ncbi:MAG TPA: hypothetical protein VNW29_03390 [Candidatus Sulfotelmatobacter sp.]|jgi:hypothetical protein|nr:hypothetical protein [Candidatus Sulfotelmatobacter sp.]
MILRKYIGLEALFFVIAGASIGLYLVSYVKTQTLQFNSNAAFTPVQMVTPPITAIQKQTTQAGQPTQKPTPITTIVSMTPVTTNAISQISSDGSQKVTIQTVQNKYATQTDNIFTVNTTIPLYSKTLSQGESINVPFNAWSPNDKYFFIQDNLSSGQSILIFQADGQPFTNGQSYLNLTDAYTKYGASDIFDQATGWAADNLIVINTKLSDGSQGKSYWYEIPDGGIIPLANKF